MKTKEIREKINDKIEYYEKIINEENKSIKSTNHFKYIDKVEQYKDLLIILGKKEDLPEEKIKIFYELFKFINNQKML